MTAPDTSIGGNEAVFPETLWASVLSAPERDSEKRREALNRLLSAYWRPVYAFIRASRRASVEDGKDLTQEFFRYVLEQDVVSSYRREKGRFRHFLKGVLRNFLDDVERARLTLKRGGGKVIISLDAGDADPDRFLKGAQTDNPEDIFDRQWAADLIAQSVAQLKHVLAQESRQDVWNVYDAYELQVAGASARTYAAVGRELGYTEDQVKDRLRQARERLELIIRQKVSDSVTSRDEMLDELNDLFSG